MKFTPFPEFFVLVNRLIPKTVFDLIVLIAMLHFWKLIFKRITCILEILFWNVYFGKFVLKWKAFWIHFLCFEKFVPQYVSCILKILFQKLELYYENFVTKILFSKLYSKSYDFFLE